MADADALGDDHTTFIKAEGMPALSRAAFQMHTFGIINSIQDGRPGFVSDGYLNAIAAETTTMVLEWKRPACGKGATAATSSSPTTCSRSPSTSTRRPTA